MSWQQPWTRWVTMVVVCVCAVWGTWWKTHPSGGRHVVTVTRVDHVREGDGLVSEAQCRSIKSGTAMSDLRGQYGVPQGAEDLTDTWDYPLREDKDRHCSVAHLYEYGFLPWQKGSEKVTKVTLGLVADG